MIYTTTSLPTTTVHCRHCGKPIKHFGGRLWHETGALIFPQYCKNGTPIKPGHATDGGGYLHEPKENAT